MTGTASFLLEKPQGDEVNVGMFVYLTDISRTDQTQEAFLYDRYHNRQTRLRTDTGFDQFRLRDDKGQVFLQGKVLHINPRELIFRVHDKVYAVHVGETVAEALRKPLTDDQVKKLPKAPPAAAPLSKGGAVTFEMRSKPWGQVLEWLSDQTGAPIITTAKPTGTFTFTSAKKKDYTLAEILDILNEALAPQQFLLIRRDQSITLVPTDNNIDPSLVPRVSIDDLAVRGKTELVSVVLPLRKLNAADIAGDVEKLLGPFGKVTALATLNQLVLQDSAGNLNQIIQTIKALEEKGARPKQPGKTIALDMRDKPWANVLEWLTEQTGLPVHAPSVPTGTLTLISPKGKTYTVPEIIDLLNDALASQKLILIRLEQGYTLIAVNQKIDEYLLPRIRPADLDQHGNSEVVSIMIPLTALVAEDMKADIEKLLGPDGRVVALAKANQLILHDRVGNLKRILQTIKDLEEAGKPRKPGQP
jgi:type II secretory pathway component GspD/PulD (secretin)